MQLHLIDVLAIVLYLLGITWFGLRFRNGERSLRSYFLADRNIPWWAIALSIVAAETSTLTIISIPGLAFTGDFGFLQIALGYLLGRIVICLLFLPRYFEGQLMTAYQLIGARFGKGLHRFTAGLFLATRAAAEGVRIFAVSIVITVAFGTGTIPSIIILTILTLIYTFEGGFSAVIWTDVVQMIIYFAGTLLALWTLGTKTPGGWSAIHHTAATAHKFTIFHFAFSLTQTYTFWGGLIGGCFLTMASHGTDQLIVQRLLAAKNLAQSQLALLASGVVVFVQFSLFLLIGAGLYVFYPAGTLAHVGTADRLFPLFIVQVMPHGISGLVIAAILAAAMSNMSAALNSLSSTTMVDFYLPRHPEMEERARTRLSRILTAVWAVVLLALAVLSRTGGHVVEIGLSIASVTWGEMLGAFLLGTLTRRATQNGTIVGMIVGLIVNLILWQQPGPFATGHAWALPKVAFIWYVLIGALITTSVGYIASLLLPQNRKGHRRMIRLGRNAVVALVAFVATAIVCAAQKPSPAVAQQTVTPSAFAPIDAIVNDAVAHHELPGAVVVIGHDGHIVFHHAYGMRSLEPTREAMTEDTIFDMASLTKDLVTATAVMQLYEQGKIRIDDPVAHYIGEFGANGKQDITIRQCLTHYSGLAPDLDLTGPWHGREEGLRRLFESAPITPPGVVFRYSDENFITLGALVERVSGLPLEVYAQRNIVAPLGLADSGYLPPAEKRSRIAPTQYVTADGTLSSVSTATMLRGVVHDPTARRMEGVAGHAGFFSTAADVSIFAQALLDRLAGRTSSFPLNQLTLAKMIEPEQPATGTALRGFGWDIDSAFSSNRGTLFPVGSFGHTGFTGTSLWIDPQSNTYVVILTNAVHPDGNGHTVVLRSRIADAAAQAVGIRTQENGQLTQLTGYNESLTGARRWIARNGDVMTGIDLLESEKFLTLQALAKKHGGHLRMGLLTNQTGLDREGRRTIDVLVKDAHAADPGLTLATIFSPEHGIQGAQDQTNISNATDTATGLPIVSLYGANDAQRRPSPESLRNLDAVVIDLQDAGVRYWTYAAAMGYFLEAAAKANIDVVVLDRPDPVTGSFVQGPVSEIGRDSYTNYMPLPVRHGMTFGELARYFNGERHLNAALTVVKMQGWQRGDWFDSTGLTWTNPSPNLRSQRAAELYTGIGLIETSNISVGRGTDTPFELLGAPWIDNRIFARTLNARLLPGVRFVPVDFTPAAPYPYAGQLCHGVSLMVMDRNALDGPELGLEIASALWKLYPNDYKLDQIDRLLVNKSVLDALRSGEDPQRIAGDWRLEIEAFMQRRAAYLEY